MKKVSQCQKNCKGFSTSILSENIKKLKGDGTLWWIFFEKKVSQSRKYSKGVPIGPLSFLDDVKILRKLLEK